MRARRLASTIAALCALGAGCATAAADPPPLSDADGLHVLSVKQLDPRLFEAKVATSALPGPAAVRILLPPGYAADPGRRYPVLYLLHGTSGAASDWTIKGDAEKTVGDRPMIVVMPDIDLNVDGGGWCTNWPNGRYRWETFHIDQLVPWIDHNLRTIRDRGGRAIAGLSQGGFCSLSYAARHPDLFGTALGYSGAPDIYYDPDARVGAMAVINATEVGLDHVAPDSMFGNPVTNAINWQAHDPATLAENLRWTRMYMYWGNGQQGPYDSAPIGGGTPIELLVNTDNIDFHKRLDALGIPAYFDPYGPGTHAWPYWARDLRESIDKVMLGFEHPVADPQQFTYTSADDGYAVYGWRVTMHRAAREFSTLRRLGADQFALSGSGTAAVVTPADYVPGARYALTLSGDGITTRKVELVAGDDGRLRLAVPLGAAGSVHTTSVTIAAA